MLGTRAQVHAPTIVFCVYGFHLFKDFSLIEQEGYEVRRGTVSVLVDGVDGAAFAIVSQLYRNCSATVTQLFRNCCATVPQLFRRCSATVAQLLRKL